MRNIKQNAKQKVVNRFAPDAFILLNEQDYIINGFGNKINFNDDISNFSINGSTDSPPAKASFSLFVPRSEEHKYFFKGKCVIAPMTEIKIFIKGRYSILYEDGEISPPKPYQQFHGVITSVSDDYSGDQHTINFECEDLLYFLKIMKMSTHPSVLHSVTTGSAATVRKSNYETANPKDIIRSVVNFAFGGEIGSNDQRRSNAVFVPETFNSDAFKSNINNSEFNTINRQEFIDTQQRIMSEYWTNRLKIVENGELSVKDSNFLQLFIFGYTLPDLIKNKVDQTDTTAQTQQTGLANDQLIVAEVETESEGNREKGQKIRNPFEIVDGRVRAATGNIEINQTAAQIDQLIEQAQPFGQLAEINVINAEYESLMDIAIVCRDYIHYEFYMSLDGVVVFKPPFYNLDVKPYRPFVIKDEDIVSFSFRESDDVITTITVKGNLSFIFQAGSEFSATGTAFDYKLAQQFMNRTQTTDLQMSANITKQIEQADFLSLYAQNMLDVHNSRRFQGSITIPGTPEIKLGYPVYIESRNMYGYVTNISHQFSFGNSYMTTLTVEAFRYHSDSGSDIVLRPSYESQVLNISHRDEEFKLKEQKPDKISGTAMDSSKVRQEFKATTNDKNGEFYKTRVQRITDIDGYELIGTIGYCADLMIDSSGNLVPKNSALDFDTSLFTENITKAVGLSKIDIDTTTNSTPTIKQKVPTQSVTPNAKGMSDMDVNNKGKQ